MNFKLDHIIKCNRFLAEQRIKNEIERLLSKYKHWHKKQLLQNKSFNRRFNLIVKQYLKCRKNTESKNPKVVKKPGRKMILSNCAVCGCKKPRFIKEQEASGI